jgi:hypothetical protein
MMHISATSRVGVSGVLLTHDRCLLQVCEQNRDQNEFSHESDSQSIQLWMVLREPTLIPQSSAATIGKSSGGY